MGCTTQTFGAGLTHSYCARDYHYSNKTESDKAGLVLSIGVLGSSVLDMVSIIAEATEREDIATATIAGSKFINTTVGLGGGA